MFERVRSRLRRVLFSKDDFLAGLNREIIPTLSELVSRFNALSLLDPTATKTSAYTAAAYDLVLADPSAGAFSVTLPTPVPGGSGIVTVAAGAPVAVICLSASNYVTLVPPAGVTINGQSSWRVSGAYGAAVLIPESAASWLVIGDALGFGVSDGDVLTWSSATTSWGPGASAGLANLQYMDTRNSPVALYNLNGVMTDSSGNGFDMAVELGTEIYTDIVPGKRGFYFNASTRLFHNTFRASLAITGPVTCLAIMQCDILSSFDGVISHGATGELSNSNLLYNAQLQFTIPLNQGWLHERGGGTNEAYLPTPTVRLPPIHNIMFVGWTRSAGNVITFNLNGRNIATSGVLTAADGGGIGRLRLGGTADATCDRFVLFSAKVVPQAYTEADFVDEYNYTMGGVYGEL